MRVRHVFTVRVVVVTESFLPEVNGVTNSVLRVLEQLQGHGHQALVLAAGRGGTASYAGATVVRALSVPVPRYRSLSIGLPSPRFEAAVRPFRPDIAHLASPVALGAHGVAVARRLAVPAVAVYQTDVPAFLARYGLGVAEPATWRWLEWIHRRAALTLAPSTHTVRTLARHGITGVEVWRRGVDAERFHPATAARPSGGGWPPAARCWWATSAGSPPRSGSGCWRCCKGCPASGWSWPATDRNAGSCSASTAWRAGHDRCP
jgi:phosphatidylinositol alpha 1,6-mannosyltransferase